jgi:hypothetical protein
MVRVWKYRKLFGNIDKYKISFVVCFLIAVFMMRCEGDRSTQNAEFQNPLANPQDGPAAGNPAGTSPVPLEAGPADISNPDHIIGNGTPESCTGDAFIKAVAQGGKIVFNCGANPVTITLDSTAKVFNDANQDIVIDGNGGNPAQVGTSGGAIYNDGDTMTLTILGTLIEKNKVNAYGSAIFFVTNDHSGDIRIDNSIIHNNTGGSWYPVYPGISMHSDTKCVVTNSTIE